MPDPGSAILGAISSLKTAGDMAGAFLKLRDAAAVQGKVIELQAIIDTAQQSAFAAQREQAALTKEKDRLERQIAEMETWNAEKDGYELKRIPGAAFVHMLKGAEPEDESAVKLCTNCFDKRRSVLQPTGNFRNGELHLCPNCGLEVPL